MEVLPAIDLRNGQVVRLAQGDYNRQTTYASDPVAVAEGFARMGAAWLHVVDLEGAKAARPVQADVVRAICRAVGSSLRIEMGGGLRSRQAIEEVLGAGVTRAVIGSAALKDWPWFEALARDAAMCGRLALGLDAREGVLAAEGWTRSAGLRAVDVAARVKGWPLGAIVYTDIARDGMFTGVNVEATAGILAATDVPVIASGGAGSIDDVRRCRDIGCAGVIIGRAWYEGRIDLAAAIRLGREKKC